METHPDTEVRGPSRRTVVRTAAWATPVVAATVAAPAYAASPCPTVTLTWSSFADGATFTSTTVGGVTVTLTKTGATTATGNGTVKNGSGALGNQTAYLQLNDLNGVNGTTQKLTFGFSAPVASVTLTLLDIDSSTQAGSTWSDNVLFDTQGYTATPGSAVVGTGGTGNLFRANGTNTQVPTTSTTGNVLVVYPVTAVFTSFAFNYSQTVSASGSPRIGVSTISFRPVLC